MIKNSLIAGLTLALAIAIGGWVISHDNETVLTKTVTEQKDDIQKKSTKIANQGDVIVKKDNDLKSKDKVIAKKDDEISKQKDSLEALSRQLEQAQDELDKEKKKVKIKYVEKETEKEVSSNFKPEVKGDDVGGRKISVRASAYIAHCKEGCTGKTATGVNVSDSIYYQGHRVIAVDASIIPLNSTVKVELNGQSFTAKAIDTGGAIKGNKIDVLVGSEGEASNFGKQNATVTVLGGG